MKTNIRIRNCLQQFPVLPPTSMTQIDKNTDLILEGGEKMIGPMLSPGLSLDVVNNGFPASIHLPGLPVHINYVRSQSENEYEYDQYMEVPWEFDYLLLGASGVYHGLLRMNGL
jgi:hypothetical protein